MSAERGADKNMATRRALVDLVGWAGLSRHEQETSMHFFGDADAFEMTTYVPSIVRSLLRHDDATILWVYADGVGERKRKVQDLSSIPRADAAVTIEGAKARLPLGALSVKGAPRGRDRPSEIVTTPEEIDGLTEELHNAGADENDD